MALPQATLSPGCSSLSAGRCEPGLSGNGFLLSALPLSAAVPCWRYDLSRRECDSTRWKPANRHTRQPVLRKAVARILNGAAEATRTR